jgi:hypothetical protein
MLLNSRLYITQNKEMENNKIVQLIDDVYKNYQNAYQYELQYLTLNDKPATEEEIENYYQGVFDTFESLTNRIDELSLESMSISK